ncbi:conjugative transfer protein [Salmonella enterica subsp. enterica]|nr:conjugative transfer protein [Salmonella enterica subsp. enterica]
MNKNVKLSLIAIAVSLFMAKQASAANTWTEARNDAMGGTGVASANYGSGVLLNPALLAKAKPEDNITVVLPAVGVQITDKTISRMKLTISAIKWITTMRSSITLRWGKFCSIREAC